MPGVIPPMMHNHTNRPVIVPGGVLVGALFVTVLGMDFSSLPGKTTDDKIQLGMKYRIRGCPPEDGDDGTPAQTCDNHMVTVLSAQVTQACCPQYDPNCGIPSYCSTACAPGVLRCIAFPCTSICPVTHLG